MFFDINFLYMKINERRLSRDLSRGFVTIRTDKLKFNGFFFNPLLDREALKKKM